MSASVAASFSENSKFGVDPQLPSSITACPVFSQQNPDAFIAELQISARYRSRRPIESPQPGWT